MRRPLRFNTLYSKLALALLVLLLLVGIGIFYLLSYTSQLYQQEVSQRLNASLAASIVKETELFKSGEINQQALKTMFHVLMVHNPAIEVYLVDTQGNILADAAPDNRVKRDKVNIEPIRRFFTESNSYPLLGDDPRALDKQKIFSAAEVIIGASRTAYLYAILGGEDYDSVAAMLQGSYILRLGMVGLALSLLIALVFGLLIFAVLTHRLSRLSEKMDKYARYGNGTNTDRSRQNTTTLPRGDEIERLSSSFGSMAKRIDSAVEELRQVDAKRRELIASVSHDLRTPLASMTGYLETLLLKENRLDEDERRRYIQIAYSHSKDLGRLVAELFELARLDSVETLLNIEPFSLAELLQDVAQKFRLAAAERQITLRTELGEYAAFAYGDIGLIQRVLENLLENAFRHTPPNGVITLSLIPGHNNITVRLADTGCGIRPEELPHIFDRFYRVQKSRGDSRQHAGLGLAIVKRIVALHGGTIDAHSTVNHGTTFSFSMPICQP
jgi:two-component system, OmpR family, sensor kinase